MLGVDPHFMLEGMKRALCSYAFAGEKYEEALRMAQGPAGVALTSIVMRTVVEYIQYLGFHDAIKAALYSTASTSMALPRRAILVGLLFASIEKLSLIHI